MPFDQRSLIHQKAWFLGGPRISKNQMFLKNGKNHPKHNAKISDMPFDQMSLIHREAWFPPCFIRQNHQKNKLFFARQFQTTFKQKCSNVRPLLSITFPQGFRISKNIFFCAAILHPLLLKVFKCETISFNYFSPRTSNFKNWWQKNV